MIWGIDKCLQGANTPFIMKSRGLSRSVAMSDMLNRNPQIKHLMDSGELVPDVRVSESMKLQHVKQWSSPHWQSVLALHCCQCHPDFSSTSRADIADVQQVQNAAIICRLCTMQTLYIAATVWCNVAMLLLQLDVVQHCSCCYWYVHVAPGSTERPHTNTTACQPLCRLW